MDGIHWYFVRSSGIVALGALWLSTVFGIGLAGRGLRGWMPPAAAVHLHRLWSVVGVGSTLLHAIACGPPRDWVPGGDEVGIGALAAWVMLGVGVSSAARQWLSPSAWRGIHASALGSYVLAVVHGWRAGSDAADPLFRAMMVAWTVSVPLLLGLRGVIALRDRPAAPRPSS